MKFRKLREALNDDFRIVKTLLFKLPVEEVKNIPQFEKIIGGLFTIYKEDTYAVCIYIKVSTAAHAIYHHEMELEVEKQLNHPITNIVEIASQLYGDEVLLGFKVKDLIKILQIKPYVADEIASDLQYALMSFYKVYNSSLLESKRHYFLKEDGVYKTGRIQYPGDIFDTSYQELSEYRDYIRNPQKEDNKIFKIVQMTPQQYFEECTKIFGTSFDTQVSQIENDEDTLNTLFQVIQRGSQLPLPIIDYTKERTQEGRHRMYVAGELYGWDKKFPVGVVNWIDEKRAEKEKREDVRISIIKTVRNDVENLKKWDYENFDEFEEEITDFMIPKWEKDYGYKCSFKDTGDYYIIYVNGVRFKLDKDKLNIKPKLDIDDLDMEDLK